MFGLFSDVTTHLSFQVNFFVTKLLLFLELYKSILIISPQAGICQQLYFPIYT